MIVRRKVEICDRKSEIVVEVSREDIVEDICLHVDPESPVTKYVDPLAAIAIDVIRGLEGKGEDGN